MLAKPCSIQPLGSCINSVTACLRSTVELKNIQIVFPWMLNARKCDVPDPEATRRSLIYWTCSDRMWHQLVQMSWLFVSIQSPFDTVWCLMTPLRHHLIWQSSSKVVMSVQQSVKVHSVETRWDTARVARSGVVFSRTASLKRTQNHQRLTFERSAQTASSLNHLNFERSVEVENPSGPLHPGWHQHKVGPKRTHIGSAKHSSCVASLVLSLTGLV